MVVRAGEYWFDAFKMVQFLIIATIAAYVVLNLALRRASAVYRKLSEVDRFLTVTHVFFCLAFALQIGPWTGLMARVMFLPGGLDHLWAAHNLAFACFLSKGLLYCTEGMVRSTVKRNWFLIIHHLLFAAFVLLAFAGMDIMTIKVDVLLDCFATYEVLLYAGLVARRLKFPLAITKALLVVGVLVYGITRLIQIMLLIAIFIVSYQPMLQNGHAAIYWIVVLGTGSLMFVQFYTLEIYRQMYVRTGVVKPVVAVVGMVEVSELRRAEGSNCFVEVLDTHCSKDFAVAKAKAAGAELV